MEQVIDPVCGMTVVPDTAAGEFEHKGTRYYFCSKGCLAKFQGDPESYLNPTQPAEPPAGDVVSPNVAIN